MLSLRVASAAVGAAMFGSCRACSRRTGLGQCSLETGKFGKIDYRDPRQVLGCRPGLSQNDGGDVCPYRFWDPAVLQMAWPLGCGEKCRVMDFQSETGADKPLSQSEQWAVAQIVASWLEAQSYLQQFAARWELLQYAVRNCLGMCLVACGYGCKQGGINPPFQCCFRDAGAQVPVLALRLTP